MRFELKAVDRGNQVVALQLDVADEAAARDLAREQGYSVLAVGRGGLSLGNLLKLKTAFPTALFSIELLALLDAGLNVVEALQTLAEKEPRGENHRVLAELVGALQRGESLSQAASHLPQVFSPLFVATLKASERTGDLKEALRRYIVYQEELDKVKRKVLSALLYPAILMVVGTLVLAFLLFYVVPRFARVYEDISANLPLFSSLLLGLGRWIESYGVLVLALSSFLLFAFTTFISKEKNRSAAAAALWRIPALGERMKIYQLARLYRTVSMLLRAGVPALRAFDMVSGLLAPNLRAQLAQATLTLSNGRSISDSLTAAGLATPVATRLMAVGEKSGQMGELMDRAARFYDDETARFVDAFTRVFEPLLMALLGLAVGLVVVLMYMPIFELAGSLG